MHLALEVAGTLRVTGRHILKLVRIPVMVVQYGPLSSVVAPLNDEGF